MASILRPYRNILNPGSKQVPTGRLQIDRQHPLSRSLIGCWLPGATGGVDVLNQVSTLTEKVNATNGSTPEGVSIVSANAAGDCGLVGLATSPFKTWTEFTLHWRGSVLGAALGGANSCICGISYDNAGGAPYVILSFDPKINSNYPGISIFHNNGGSFDASVAFDNIINSYNIVYSLTACVLVSAAAGSSYFYVNGSQAGTFAFGTAPTSSATSSIIIGTDPYTIGRSSNISTNLVYCWNRQLAAYEVANLHQNPYQFLLPDEIEMPMLFIPSAPSILYGHNIGASFTRKVTTIGY